MAIKMSRIKNVIVLLNKLDLVTKKVAMERYTALVDVLAKHDIEAKRIIPVCMNHMIGVEVLLESIMEFMPPKEKNIDLDPLFMASRSFDVNHPNIPYTDIVGGVVGGSILRGQFKVGDTIEICPGIITNKNGTVEWKPHHTTITSIKSDTTDLNEASPGGLIGIGTDIDPYYCKNDMMAGQMIGLKGKMPPTVLSLTTKFEKIEFDGYCWEPKVGNNITVITGTYCGDGKITKIDGLDEITVTLQRPVCIDMDNMIVLCEKTRDAFHIVGCGNA